MFILLDMMWEFDHSLEHHRNESHSSVALGGEKYLQQLRQQIKNEVTQELTQSLLQGFEKQLETFRLLQQPSLYYSLTSLLLSRSTLKRVVQLYILRGMMLVPLATVICVLIIILPTQEVL